MSKNSDQLPTYLRCFRILAQFALFGVVSACSSINQKPESAWQEVAFDINGAFILHMKLPPVESGVMPIEPTFKAVEKETSERLFLAEYDPGSGRLREILLTSIWATVVRFPESSLKDNARAFDEIKATVFEDTKEWQNSFSYKGYEEIAEFTWLSVSFDNSSWNGAGFTTVIFDDYALILGVRVFDEHNKLAELREHRINTLRQIAESIRVEPL
jgi:hypothetical protein